MRSDVEFVSQLSARLGADYSETKSYVRDVPTQALLHIRSMTHWLVNQIGQMQQLTFDGPNLYDRIEQLNKQRLINVRTTRLLHKLRGHGNRGAHPEKYHLSSTQLVALAEKAVADFLALIEMLYPLFTQQQAPSFAFVHFDQSAGRDLCYRALWKMITMLNTLWGCHLKIRR